MNGFSIGAIVGGFALAAVGIFASSKPVVVSNSPVGKVGTDPGSIKEMGSLKPKSGDELASFSGGCFWGLEDEFRQVPGVVATAVGFTGGHTKNPSYEDVCTHTTGHAETVLIEFDPNKISYRQLVDKFWEFHDPTTINRQGPDEGDNYRSAIWTYSEEEAKVARESLRARQPKESSKIVTTIMSAQPFYLAEDYHQQYDEKTGRHFCPTRTN